MRKKGLTKKHRKNTKIRVKKPAMRLISLLSLMLVIATLIIGFKTYSENEAYAKSLKSQQKKLQEEQARTKEIEDFEAYVKTKEFFEEIAKNRFGLVYKDEIIYKKSE
ncbi:Cell division protein FtsB [Acetitomaculum ruminis DSM 5522]|uniref:Cell division protein FtsB n=1 Tax=Acetitomaculum ruminis DSM 5522 TaxID=1120918 RepID=A0A1I0W1U9_9FIRM|nr:septum formation initiator family protein [Acetitomaculum ruminis]SFA82592.1 Cell division protein FtsB [Acetitomaculum ruminis DSM 5522]